MKKLFTLPLLLLLLWGCNEEESVIVQQGSVQFSILEKIASNTGGRSVNGRTTSETPAKIIVSITSSTGASIIDRGEFDVFSFGNAFLVEPILLETGDYRVSEFLVLDENADVILATPIEGSVLASLVDSPLSTAFSITPDMVTELSLEVISTTSVDPEDLGYVSINFNVIPTLDILVSVFAVNPQGTAFEFVASDLLVIADGDSLFTQSLGDSINVVKRRSDFDEVTLVAATRVGNSEPITLSSNTLQTFVDVPLDIIIPRNSVSRGLFALVDDQIVELNTETGEATEALPIINFPANASHSALTFDPINRNFYLLQNPSSLPVLVKIDALGRYEEIGNITLGGVPMRLAEALAFDGQAGVLYMAASLNGTPGDNDDFWSESLLTLDPSTAEATLVTEIITNARTQPESDTDDLAISNGVLYFIDNAPPSANFTSIYSLPIDQIVQGGETSPALLQTRSHLVGARIAVTGDQLYLTSERKLLGLDLGSPTGFNFVGITHGGSEFNGAPILGVTFVE